MDTTDLATYRDNIKRLVDKSVFMPEKLREKVLKKINNPKTSREKLDKIYQLLRDSWKKEEEIIVGINQQDPLFFVKEKHRQTREKLEKVKKEEDFLRNQELKNMETELENFLNN